MVVVARSNLQYLCLGPIAADIIEFVLFVGPADDGAVNDVGFLWRRGVDIVDIITAAGHG
jgi:hypothetical protein